MDDQHDIARVPDALTTKKRKPALRRVMASLIGWGVIFSIAAAAVLVWGWTAFTAEGPLKQAKIIFLPDGASRSNIVGTLGEEGVISDHRVMNGAAILWSLRGRSLKSGEYEFQPGASMANVLDIISSGRVVTHKITIPEGWTSRMALERINSNEILTGDPVAEADVPEGAIIADTAVFPRGMTRAKLVNDMMAAQAKAVDEIWKRRPADLPLRSKEELVTLASIVERETGLPEERPRVAAVFLNRLKQGMRLQSDPTIIYGIAGGQGKLDRALTREDIDAVTPYNTYQIDGLPPGPIAIPGRTALEAVIAPAPTADLYFVADGTGGHAFAKTLEEHNANVAKWRSLQGGGALAPANPAAAATEGQAEDTANNTVIRPELPAPDVSANTGAGTASASPGAEEAAIAEAAQTQQGTQPVPAPETGATAVPKPVEETTKAVAGQEAGAQEADAQATGDLASSSAGKLVPGTVVQIGGRKVPVPLIKQKRKL